MEIDTVVSSLQAAMSDESSKGLSLDKQDIEGLTSVEDIFANSQDLANSQPDSAVNMLGNAIDSYTEFEGSLRGKLDSFVPEVKEGDGMYAQQKSLIEGLANYQEVYIAKSLTSSLLMSTGKSSESFVKTLMRSQ